MGEQADMLDELRARYPGGIPKQIKRTFVEFGDRYIANRESQNNPAVEADIVAKRKAFMKSPETYVPEPFLSADQTPIEWRSTLQRLIDKASRESKT